MKIAFLVCANWIFFVMQHVPARIPEDEEERLVFLRSLNILETSAEESFDRITQAAFSILKVPIAIVCMVDEHRNWFKSKVGVGDASEADRRLGFCGHTILQDHPLIVEDAMEDERFKYSEVITAAGFRFYAGVPLLIRSERGKCGKKWNVGTLCVLDFHKRTLDSNQILSLLMLSRLVIAEIELRDTKLRQSLKRIAALNACAQARAQEMHASYIGQVAHDLRTPLSCISHGLRSLSSSALDAEQLQLVDTMSVSAELMSLTCAKAVHAMAIALAPAGAPAPPPVPARRPAPLALAPLLARAARAVRGYHHESPAVLFDYAVAPGVAPRVVSDEAWVWEMLMALLCIAS
jgi:hypothetical protein